MVGLRGSGLFGPGWKLTGNSWASLDRIRAQLY
jgi:hypothetical protein